MNQFINRSGNTVQVTCYIEGKNGGGERNKNTITDCVFIQSLPTFLLDLIRRCYSRGT